MHLKLRHLEVFDAVMEAGSVSHAAERLNVSQPAVSVALANLERELGFRLFHRTRGFFSPTAEARELHAEAEQGLLALARVRRRAEEIRAGDTGSLTIGSNGAMAINVLPGLIAGFRARRPRVSVDLKIRSSRRVAALVAGRQLDIGLIDAPVPEAGLDARLYRIPCVCILREDDPLAGSDTVRPAMLAGRALIGITGEHEIDRRLDALMAGAGATPDRRVTASFFAVARNLVRAGAGVALVDALNGRLEAGDGVTWRPFAPSLDYGLAVITASGTALHAPGAALLAGLEEVLATVEAPPA